MSGGHSRCHSRCGRAAARATNEAAWQRDEQPRAHFLVATDDGEVERGHARGVGSGVDGSAVLEEEGKRGQRGKVGGAMERLCPGCVREDKKEIG